MGCENKILLLNGPQHFDNRRPVTQEFRRFSEYIYPLGSGIVAAVAKQHGLEVEWRQMQPGKVQDLAGVIENVGGVFISSRHFDTSLAQEAIALTGKLGKKSVVGGYGPTFNPQAFNEADSIVRGEAESILPVLIDDYRSGCLNSEYDSRGLPAYDISDKYIWPDRSIYPAWPAVFKKLQRHPQEWQRGCTNYCSFCSPTRLQRNNWVNKERQVRVRKTQDIIAEIESMKLENGDNLFSTDLNTSEIPREDLLELFSYLKNKNIRWYTEGTALPLLDDYFKYGKESLIDLMSAKDGKGGCYSFLYGADDLVSARVAGSFDKQVCLVENAAELFREKGIPLNLSVVVGLDNHTYPGSFFEIAQVLEETSVPYSFVHIATPYIGTPWGDKVSKEGRLIDLESTHYNHRQVVHQPRGMTADELQQGYYWLLRTLNSPSAITRTAKRNFEIDTLKNTPFLGVIQTGLPWGMETYLSTLELQARGYIDTKIQSELDSDYSRFKKGK